MSGKTELFQTLGAKAEAHFEWAQAHPKFGLLIAAALLALWLVGLIRGWKWALHWNFNSRLCFFDDCSASARRYVQIAIISIAIISCIVLFFYL